MGYIFDSGAISMTSGSGGDGKYLQIANDLSEIADAGPDAQQEACGNIGALPTSGGALTGPLGFHGGDGTQAYAINRQAVWSLIDVYNALPLANSAWNKVGTVDTTKNQYGRVLLTLVGSMSHDVGMAVQTGFVNIDIIGTEGSNPPGLTLTFFVPDEAKGAVIQTAVLSASPTQDKCFDLWVKTQTAVAGIMPYAKQTTAGYLTLYDTFETTDTDPEPSTPTGIVHLVSANEAGDVNVKGSLKSEGPMTPGDYSNFDERYGNAPIPALNEPGSSGMFMHINDASVHGAGETFAASAIQYCSINDGGNLIQSYGGGQPPGGTWELRGYLVASSTAAHSAATFIRTDTASSVALRSSNGVSIVRNPKYSAADNSLIDCELFFRNAWHPFTANPNDVTWWGREIYERAQAGEYGDVAAYVAPEEEE
ncbi:TPA: hypothetical protein ACP41M_001064 [Klebsiella aerogenes]